MPVPDFSVGEVLTSQAMDSIGLWLVKTQTVGTAVASVVVANAFSADYENYLITMNGGTGSANSAITMQLSGSTTAYNGFLNFGNAAGAGTPLGAAVAGSSWPFVGGATSGQAAHVSCELFNPFLATNTKIVNAAYQNGDNYGTFTGEHRVSSSFTGFSISPSSGTLTGGIIRVYGFRK
jgi:hypothetical protein